jgi:peptidoglycan/xylan/chitin deacetylase (PgdA/CDA1 family)
MVRIPYGATDASIRPKVAAEGAQIFDWDINSNDSTLRGVKDHQLIERSVFKHLSRSAKRHQVVLFHDGAGHDSTQTALKELIPRLKQEGYRFGLLVRSEKTARSSAPQQVLQ